jgi:hypothetical protein
MQIKLLFRMILNKAEYKVGWSIPPDILSNARPVRIIEHDKCMEYKCNYQIY